MLKNSKIAGLLVVVLLVSLVFVGCFPDRSDPQDDELVTYEPTEPANVINEPVDDEEEAEVEAPEPVPVPAEPATTQPAANETLIGEWNWLGSLYYTFQAGGRGIRFGAEIMWSSRNGVLTICSTPAMCGSVNACSAPEEWNYTISGNELTLTSRQVAGMTFTYTRR